MLSKELGLEEVFSFQEITSDAFTRRVLEELYGDVNDVDAYVGGMAEDHVPNTNIGPLFYASLKDQYQRIRDGDRLYYENTQNGLFTADQIAEIKATGLRDIILRNTGIQVGTTQPFPCAKPQFVVSAGKHLYHRERRRSVAEGYIRRQSTGR